MKSIDSSKIFIKTINPEETYEVRLPVLRPGKPIESCKFDGDNLNTTFHIGLFYTDKLVAVASYMGNSNLHFSASKQYQLRGMAVLHQYQGLGLGNLLLKKGEEHCKIKQADLIWFNARENAVNFYKRNNYHETGAYFNIEGVGTHIMMSKNLLKTTFNKS
ncbi:GNAT family N-acetyltransferase [Aurantibacter aestuarii]|uniref:GNAT family N-acetyltransferase n=1 Tax=Aurantibacter aestuarii TaxID=1266046 RepID=A0A2T1NFQ6_9FLAO|nr:GNAT family N-acetyltransferase [Aurantibacter aestuarii]PSG91622.1 GNAT family N-acetyltransferase [Aurantibacter aestuarii]